MKRFLLILITVVLCAACRRTEEPVLLPAGETIASLEEPLLWGFIDGEGQWVIPAQFEDAEPFTEDGYACVTYEG